MDEGRTGSHSDTCTFLRYLVKVILREGSHVPLLRRNRTIFYAANHSFFFCCQHFHHSSLFLFRQLPHLLKGRRWWIWWIHCRMQRLSLPPQGKYAVLLIVDCCLRFQVAMTASISSIFPCDIVICFYRLLFHRIAFPSLTSSCSLPLKMMSQTTRERGEHGLNLSLRSVFYSPHLSFFRDSIHRFHHA
jgi:hypothetical protein